VHQHVQLQFLWLLQCLRLLLLEREQRHLRRRRPWVAVLVLRSRHRLQGLRRRPAACIPASIAARPSTIATIASAAAAAAPIAAIAAATAAAAPTARLVAEPTQSAPVSSFAAKSTAIAACAAKVSTPAAAPFPSAASVPLPTGRGCPVHEHVHVQLLLVLHPAVRLLLLLEPEQRLLRRRRPRVAVLVLLSRHRLQ